MRLINVSTLALEEYISIPPTLNYACLSHRWSDEEVSFQEWRTGTPSLTARAGFRKVVAACQIVSDLGYTHLWADTCCIDKSNSTELSEAINSMWDWYRGCRLCVAFLADVDAEIVHDTNGRTGNEQWSYRSFCDSEWFQRAWTLQELLAPRNIIFYAYDWSVLGEKLELLDEIEEATSIGRKVLQNRSEIEKCSVAQRLSWAAPRRATRIEDNAYSLLGLFNVNIPLLYGEGPRAFYRLQHAILAQRLDISILAWNHLVDEPVLSDSELRDLPVLAPEPTYFAQCRNVERLNQTLWEMSLFTTFSISDISVQLELNLIPWKMNVFLADVAWDKTTSAACAIGLRRVGKSDLMTRCAVYGNAKRHTLHGLKDMRRRKVSLLLCEHTQPAISYNGLRIPKAPDLLMFSGPERNIWFDGSCEQGDNVVDVLMGTGERSYGTIACILIKNYDTQYVLTILLGYDPDYSPMCLIFPEPVTCYAQLHQDASKFNPNLCNSSWTTGFWDTKDKIDVHETSHERLDLGNEASIFRSKNRQGFSTGMAYEIAVKFYTQGHRWVAELKRNTGTDTRVRANRHPGRNIASYRNRLKTAPSWR